MGELVLDFVSSIGDNGTPTCKVKHSNRAVDYKIILSVKKNSRLVKNARKTFDPKICEFIIS